MLSFAAATYPSAERWKAPLSDLGAAYYATLTISWPIWMLLFGIYFPEVFEQRSWRERWRWVECAVVIPLACLTLIHIITFLGTMRDYTSVRSLLSLQTRLGPIESALTVAGAIGFFACMGLKLRLASSPDARRRLRLLLTGTVISLAPMGTLIVATWLHGWVLGSHFPDWLWIATFLMTFLFPLTLAYVIVVERAMDVRVVVRQGLRYAFAKSGVNAIQIGFGVGLIALLIFVLGRVKPYSLPFLLVIAFALVVSVKSRQTFRKLRLWIDRKFFRDAYNAEQILSDLGDQMRSILEPRPLLEKVCRSIADSLHVPRIAVLLEQHGVFKPAHALGYASPPEVSFPKRASAVEQMRRTGEPVTVYVDDPNSWIQKTSAEERAGLEALGAQLLLPLAASKKLLGFASLGEKRSEEPYSRSDIRLLKSVATQAGLALENAQLSAALAEEAAQRERLNRELEIAREVQERLFPQNLPPVPGLDYCGVCRPAARVDSNLAGLVTSVSRLLFEASATNRYATLFYAQYEVSTRRLAYVNAGHNPPLLLRRRGDDWMLERLREGGTVIGLFEQVSYCQALEDLDDGSLLVAFTDGATEAINRQGEEWGDEGLIEVVCRAASLSASEIIRHIFAALDSFTAGTPQQDDITLVVLRAV